MYIPLQNVEPTNKRYLLAIDVSGSMSWGNCHGTTITPRVASAAMAMLTARTEPQYHFVGFSHHLVPLNINSTQRLDTVVRTIEQVTVNTLFFQLLRILRPEDGDSGGKVPKKVKLHSFGSIFTMMYSNLFSSVKCRESRFLEFGGQGGLFELEILRHGGILTIGIP